MARSNLRRWSWLGFFVALPACGAAEALEDPGPFQSEAGNLEIWFPNASFTRGKNLIELCVSEKETGNAVDELEIEVVPYMPSMGHGSSGPSPSLALGGGCYAFAGIILNMPGTWELRTKIRGSFEDTATPTLFVR